MYDLRDFRPELRQAVAELRAAGYHGEAHVLAAALEGAYRTAPEMVGEIGGAVLRVGDSLGAGIPAHVETAFSHALVEVQKVWPTLH